MIRATEVRRALEDAVREIAPEAKAMAAGTKYEEGLHGFAVRIAVGDPDDEATMERLDEMLDDEGERSVKATLEANSDLGGVISNLIVVQNSGHRLFPVPGAPPVLGAEWLIQVL